MKITPLFEAAFERLCANGCDREDLLEVLGACLFGAGLAQGRYEEARQRQAEAQQEARPAAGALLLDHVPAPAANNRTEYDYYSAQDLQTQRDMARWAFLQLVVSAGGLFLLYRTLRYTADATRAAADAAIAAQKSVSIAERDLTQRNRPRLFVHVTENTLWSVKGMESRGLTFSLSNVGEHTAHIEAYWIDYLINAETRPVPGHRRRHSPNFDGEHALMVGRDWAIEALVGFDWGTAAILDDLESDPVVHATGLIKYRDHLGNPREYEFCFVCISPSPEGQPEFEIREYTDDREGEAAQRANHRRPPS